MKIRRNVAIALSGLTWMGIGVLLLFKGFSLLLVPSSIPTDPLFLSSLETVTSNSQQAALIVICAALFVGFLKGRLVLGKTANRLVSRIISFPDPCPIGSIYPFSYLMLLSTMICLGMLLKWIPIPYDMKGFIDVAIGSALANGSSFYFRYFTDPKAVKK